MARVEWDGDLFMKVDQLPDKFDAALGMMMNRQATVAERHMKQMAPWNDQTGNARQSLSARAGKDGPLQHYIDLAHGMPYGIWLEVRWSGRLAIVRPSVESQGREVMRNASQLLGMMT